MTSRFRATFPFGGVACAILLLQIGSNAQLSFPDTLWVPVIFYDYHADGEADFETCEDPNSDVGKKGMITPVLDAQRKPVSIPSIACLTIASSFPCACHLNEWFRISGQSGSDNSCSFQCDSLTDPDKPRWSWTNLVQYKGRTGEFIGPHFNENYAMANVAIYDSLCFRYVPNSNGMYRFINDEFLPLDNRGFGDEPADLVEPHNFGFTMELHTKFKYQKGLTFSFRGDDDVWAFINGKLAMDLGGLHYYMDGYIDLDTIADLVPGQTYSFDLYYAERHSTGSHIHITSNVISASPSEVHIAVFPSDTIKAGDTVTIVGTVTDEDGEAMPIQSDSIRWTQVKSNVKDGDTIVIPRNDTTKFTATVAYRRVGIIGTYRSATAAPIIDTAWIYILPGDPTLVDIGLQNATPLTRDQVAGRIDTFKVTPQQTVTLTMGQNNTYVYAVLRDRFGNFCRLADNAVWTSQNPAATTVDFTTGSAFEGKISRPQGVYNASTTVTASQESLIPDTARIVLNADTLIALRLVNALVPTKEIIIINMTTDSTITLKLQGTWSNDPATWVDLTGTWSLDPPAAITLSVPLPDGTVGQWTLAPSTPGSTRLTTTSHGISVTVPVFVVRADRQGPYVLNAVFTVAPLGGSYDTLNITFSEPVLCDSLKSGNQSPGNSFKIYGPGNSLKADVFDGAYYPDGATCSDRYITETTVVLKTKVDGIVPGRDSIVLYGSAVDTADNHPDTTHRGPIVYGPGAGISIVPYKNTDPTSSPMVIPPEMSSRFGIDEQMRQTKLIMIQTRGPLVPDTTSSGEIHYGKSVVYDPVANLVAVDLPIYSAPFDDRLYYVLWNGTNRLKRKVASGAYLLKTTVRYSSTPEVAVFLHTKFTINWK